MACNCCCKRHDYQDARTRASAYSSAAATQPISNTAVPTPPRVQRMNQRDEGILPSPNGKKDDDSDTQALAVWRNRSAVERTGGAEAPTSIRKDRESAIEQHKQLSEEASRRWQEQQQQQLGRQQHATIPPDSSNTTHSPSSNSTMTAPLHSLSLSANEVSSGSDRYKLASTAESTRGISLPRPTRPTSGDNGDSKPATTTAERAATSVDELDAIVFSLERHGSDQTPPPSASPVRISPSHRDSPPIHLAPSDHPSAVLAQHSASRTRSLSPQRSMIPPSSFPIEQQQRYRTSSRSPSPQRLPQTPPAPATADQARRATTRSSRSPSPQRLTPTTLEQLRMSPNLIESPPAGLNQEGTVQMPTMDEALSDVPSDVDSVTRERYLQACRVLKMALIDQETTLQDSEKQLLRELLSDAERTPSEATWATIEATTASLLKKRGNDNATPPSPSSYYNAIYSKHSPDTTPDRTLLQRRISLERSASPLYSMTTDPSQRIYPRSPASRPGMVRQESRTPSLASVATFDGRDYPFLVLGVEDFKPSVLTPAMMEALRGFFPVAVSEENFWLKYSLKRDGASLHSLLSKVKASRYTVLSVETTEGHVFGSFCSTPWRVNPSWFGSGECFLWRLKNSRIYPGGTRRSYEADNEMEVYPFTGHDHMIQYCTVKTIAVGGGDWDQTENTPHRQEPRGIGFMIDGDLMGGETNSCATFANPRLGNRVEGGTEFEIEGLEVWTVTPCSTVDAAERLESQRLFIEENMRRP